MRLFVCKKIHTEKKNKMRRKKFVQVSCLFKILICFKFLYIFLNIVRIFFAVIICLLYCLKDSLFHMNFKWNLLILIDDRISDNKIQTEFEFEIQ